MKKILSALCASTIALSAVGMVSFADNESDPTLYGTSSEYEFDSSTDSTGSTDPSADSDSSAPDADAPRQVAVTDFGAMFYVMGNPKWTWASAGESLLDENGKWTATVDIPAVVNQSRQPEDETVGRAGVLVYFCEGEYYGENAMFKAKFNFTVTKKDGTEVINKNEFALFTVVKKADGSYEATTGDDKLVLAGYGSSWDELIDYGTVNMTVTMLSVEQLQQDDPSSKDDSSKSDPVTPAPTKKSLSKAKVKAANKVYNGKAITPKVKVTLDGKTLKNGTDYTASYKNNKKCGKAAFTVSGKGSYTGKKSGSFIIKPKKAVAKKLTSKKAGTAKFTWKKSAGGVTGYQVQVANNKKFSKAKTYTIKSAKTTSKSFKNLKSKKTYFAKVRAYKTVGKKNYTGAWSAVKSVKVK